MNAFYQALESGYPPEEILKYLSKAIPQMAVPIKKATHAGYPVQQILGFLSKSFDTEDRRGMSESERHAANTRADTERTKYGLKIAGAAIASPLAGIAARSALSRALPSSIQSMLPGIADQANMNVPSGQQQGSTALGSTPQVPPEQNLIPSSSQPSPINAPNLPQPTTTPQPEVNPINVGEILNKHGLLRHVDELSKGKRDPKSIAAILYSKFPKEMQAFQKESGKNMEDAIADYMAQKPTNEKVPKPIESVEAEKIDLKGMGKGITDNLYIGMFEALKKGSTKFAGIEDPFLKKAKPLFDEGKIKSSEDLQKFANETSKIEKGSTVASPQGIGDVREIRNGKALIEVDGKLHKVNENELEAEPEEVKKSKLEFDLSKIPENLRSAPLNEVYVPAHRKHLTIKYNSDVGKEKGKRYIFWKKDSSSIDESIIEKLRTGSQIPVTSGKNFWGGWDANTQDSRGTVAYHELSSLAQKEGEEDDPSKPYWFEEEEELFMHGYSKEAEKQLLEAKKKFDEEEKRKKKAARKRL